MRPSTVSNGKSGVSRISAIVIRRRAIADHLVRGAVDERAVQDAVPRPCQGHSLVLLQEVIGEYVVVVDALFIHQLAGDYGLRVEVEGAGPRPRSGKSCRDRLNAGVG